MVQYIKIQSSAIIFGIVMILIIHSRINLDKSNKNDITFMRIMETVCVVLMLEVADLLLEGNGGLILVSIKKVINCLDIMFAIVYPILASLLIHGWINKKITLAEKTYLCILFAVNTFVAIISYKGGIAFSVTLGGNYTRGKYYFITILCNGLLYVFNELFLILNRKKYSLKEFINFSMLSIFPIIFGGMQIFLSNILTMWSSLGVCILINYLFILNYKIKIDPLTQVENRNSYYIILSKINNNDSKLSVINIDMDGLKKINDTYGHNAGDKAIKEFAAMLKKVFCNSSRIMRMGGDEFLIFLYSNDKSEIENKLNLLNEKIEHFNEENKGKTLIGFSCGFECYSNKFKDVRELIKYCDKVMYKNKKAKKEKLRQLQYE